MFKFLQAYRYLIKFQKHLDAGTYDGNMPILKQDFKAVMDALHANLPDYPYAVDSDIQEEIVEAAIRQHQDEIGKEYKEAEPELRYKNEWDLAESIHQFEEYLIKGIAQKSTDEIFELIRPDVEKSIRTKLRDQTPQSNIKEMYDRLSK